jgi:hypothetical protein
MKFIFDLKLYLDFLEGKSVYPTRYHPRAGLNKEPWYGIEDRKLIPVSDHPQFHDHDALRLREGYSFTVIGNGSENRIFVYSEFQRKIIFEVKGPPSTINDHGLFYLYATMNGSENFGIDMQPLIRSSKPSSELVLEKNFDRMLKHLQLYPFPFFEIGTRSEKPYFSRRLIQFSRPLIN